MTFMPVLAALTAFGLLTACDGKPECTQELVIEKTTDLMTKIQQLGTSDPAKMVALLPKIQDITTQAAAAGEGDLQASCDAIDDIMAELNK